MKMYEKNHAEILSLSLLMAVSSESYGYQLYLIT